MRWATTFLDEATCARVLQRVRSDGLAQPGQPLRVAGVSSPTGARFATVLTNGRALAVYRLEGDDLIEASLRDSVRVREALTQRPVSRRPGPKGAIRAWRAG